MKNNKVPIWERINDRFSITELVSLESDNRCDCLVNGNTESSSFRYFPETNTAFCYKCNQVYDYISVYGLLNNLDRSGAIKDIAIKNKIQFGKYHKKYLDSLEEIDKLFKLFTELCHKNLKKSKYYEEIKSDRGISNDTIDSRKIGLFDDNVKQSLKLNYRDNLAHYGKLLRKAGFVNKNGNWIIGKRIVIPYLDANRGSKYFIYRLLDKEPDFKKDAKYVKQRKTKYVEEIPYGLDSINEINGKPLIITEGVIDAISVIEIGYPCLSPVTTRIKKTHIDKIINYCKRFDKIVVINDNETNNAGLEGSKATLRVLLPRNINAYIGIIPNPNNLEKIDLDDFLRENSVEVFQKLLNNSTNGFDYFLNNIEKNATMKQIYEIFDLLPFDNLIVRNRVFDILKDTTGYNKTVISDQYRNYLKEKSKSMSIEIAKEILKTHHIYSPEEFRREILFYEDGRYVIKSFDYIEKIVLDYFEKNQLSSMGDPSQSSKLGMVKKYIKKETYCSIKDFDIQGNLINLLNGIIDYSDLNHIKFLKHDPELKFIRQIPIKYDPNAKCPAIEKFLSEVFHPEDVPLIKQIIGLCLTPIMRYQKAILFYGTGHNGKTIFFSIITMFIGPENTSKVDLADLDDKFEFAKIENKLLNLCSEVETDEKINIKKFKEYVGNELYVYIRKLYQEAYQVKPTAKLMYAVNDKFPELPTGADKGFFRKWMIIVCPNEFDGSKDKKKLIAELTTPQELSGLLNIALEGLKLLLKEDDFDQTGIASFDWKDIKDFWIKKMNPIEDFIEGYCEKGEYLDAKKDPNNIYWCDMNDCLLAYNEWRKSNNKTTLKGTNKITSYVKTHPDFQQTRRAGKQIYTGFRLRDSLKPKDKQGKIDQFKKTK